jgi:hypothetical protein
MPALLHRLPEVASGEHHRGSQSEQRHGHGGDRHHVDQHPPIDPPIDVVRNGLGGQRRIEQSEADLCDNDRKRATQEHKPCAFHQDQPHGAPSGCTECRANGKLLATHCPAREHEVRQVGADDQQDEGHRAHHRHRGERTVLAAKVVGERDEAHRPPAVRRRMRGGEPGGNCSELTRCPLQRDIGTEAPVHGHAAVRAERVVRDCRERNPQRGKLGEAESFRHYSDDGVRPTVHSDHSAED